MVRFSSVVTDCSGVDIAKQLVYVCAYESRSEGGQVPCGVSRSDGGRVPELITACLTAVDKHWCYHFWFIGQFHYQQASLESPLPSRFLLLQTPMKRMCTFTDTFKPKERDFKAEHQLEMRKHNWRVTKRFKDKQSDSQPTRFFSFPSKMRPWRINVFLEPSF